MVMEQFQFPAAVLVKLKLSTCGRSQRIVNRDRRGKRRGPPTAALASRLVSSCTELVACGGLISPLFSCKGDKAAPAGMTPLTAA